MPAISFTFFAPAHTDREIIFKSSVKFSQISWKFVGSRTISGIVRALGTLAIVREVASYALSKFSTPTTLGHPQNIQKTNWKKIDIFVFFKISVSSLRELHHKMSPLPSPNVRCFTQRFSDSRTCLLEATPWTWYVGGWGACALAPQPGN